MSERIPAPQVPYSPPFAPLVGAVHDVRRNDPVTGQVEPMKFRVTCQGCSETYDGVCDTGRVRERVNKWAILHLHRDTFAAPRRA
jgi:hypothetical protein